MARGLAVLSALARGAAVRYTSPMRRFNIAGPCQPERHYMIPPERRFGDAPALIDRLACGVA